MSYIHHNGQVGVLVELNCETDFVARTEGFQQLARDVALHIASADPIGVNPEDIPADLLERERRIAEEQVAAEGKPENVRAKIVEGKLKKFVAERTLLGAAVRPGRQQDRGPADQGGFGQGRRGNDRPPVRPVPGRRGLMALAYSRALLKLSGEALAGDKGFGLDFHVIEAFAEEIKAVHALGAQLWPGGRRRQHRARGHGQPGGPRPGLG